MDEERSAGVDAMTDLLMTYDEFVARVDRLGFMAMSNLLTGIPSLGGETPESLWHTGQETDPWRWKDRAAEEKRLAYGCILGGHKGFVAQRLYPVFYAAFHPTLSMQERWENGLINRTTWQVWQLFEEGSSLNTSEVRKTMGITRKADGRAVDTAIQQLQREYFITVSGSERKVSAKGEPYGWPVNRYSRVPDWAPADWLEGSSGWSVDAAQAAILDLADSFSNEVNLGKLAKKFGW